MLCQRKIWTMHARLRVYDNYCQFVYVIMHLDAQMNAISRYLRFKCESAKTTVTMLLLRTHVSCEVDGFWRKINNNFLRPTSMGFNNKHMHLRNVTNKRASWGIIEMVRDVRNIRRRLVFPSSRSYNINRTCANEPEDITMPTCKYLCVLKLLFELSAAARPRPRRAIFTGAIKLYVFMLFMLANFRARIWNC